MIYALIVAASLSATTPVEWARQNKSEAHIIVFSTNVAFGCIKSGVGMAYHGQNFFEGCAKGIISGAISHAGMWIATHQEHVVMGAVGKLVHDLGTSMSDNLARGEDWFYSYSTDLGPVNLTFAKGKVPQVSFAITPIVSMIVAASSYEFDWKRSLSNLTPVFKTKKWPASFMKMEGYSAGPLIAYKSDSLYSTDYTVSHEMVHTLQWRDLQFCGDLFFHNRWINIGQDLCHLALFAPSVNKDYYLHSPLEFQAYAIEHYPMGY